MILMKSFQSPVHVRSMVEPSTIGLINSYLSPRTEVLQCELLIPDFHSHGADDFLYPNCLHFSLFPHVGFLCGYVCPKTSELETKTKSEVQVY